MHKSILRLTVASILLLLIAGQAISDPTNQYCPRGQYYVRALGGYVLLPARYMPYAFELEEGMTGSYRSPSPPMGRRCLNMSAEIRAGNIQTGTVDAVTQTSGKIPTRKPQSKRREGNFEVTIWSIPAEDKETVTEWWTVVITKNNQAMRIFDADPELWRRILDSYFEQ